MIALILAIFLNTFIGVVFKLFQRFGISNLQAIVVNYFICAITGCLYLKKWPYTISNLTSNAMIYAAVMGFFFFVVFVLISKSTIQNGVSTTSISNKLSLIIPVLVAWVFTSESFHIFKWLGIILAIASVWFSSQKNKEQNSSSNYLLPIGIFLGSGFLDTATNYIQANILPTSNDKEVYLIFCFSTAAVLSTLFLIYQITKGKEKFASKAILAGVILGIPNYFSILTFIQALHSKVLQSSAIIPVINIGVVLASSLIGFLVFKEKMQKPQWIGLVLSVVAIGLIILGDNYASI
jgi:drug/metabolite transporter (DMT)-like permease